METIEIGVIVVPLSRYVKKERYRVVRRLNQAVVTAAYAYSSTACVLLFLPFSLSRFFFISTTTFVFIFLGC